MTKHALTSYFPLEWQAPKTLVLFQMKIWTFQRAVRLFTVTKAKRKQPLHLLTFFYMLQNFHFGKIKSSSTSFVIRLPSASILKILFTWIGETSLFYNYFRFHKLIHEESIPNACKYCSKSFKNRIQVLNQLADLIRRAIVL